MQPAGIGLDIGGANLKAAHTNGAALVCPFELWRRPGDLAGHLAELVRDLSPADRIAVTMTGELCDCFETKREGVGAILDAVAAVLPADQVGVWSTGGRFLPVRAAGQDFLRIAAANWHALAAFAGRFAPNGPAILIDVGSTTTDIIPLLNGAPVPRGITDSERLRTGELVYTGVTRTPLCALLGERVMAEFFATTQDAYVMLGLIPELPTQRSTADGRPATRRHAHYRLARLLGGDGELTPEQVTMDLAKAVEERQRDLIVRALHQVASTLPGSPRTCIVSGSGEWLAGRSWASFMASLDRAVVAAPTVIELCNWIGPAASAAACAYALAVLASERGDAWP